MLAQENPPGLRGPVGLAAFNSLARDWRALSVARHRARPALRSGGVPLGAGFMLGVNNDDTFAVRCSGVVTYAKSSAPARRSACASGQLNSGAS